MAHDDLNFLLCRMDLAIKHFVERLQDELASLGTEAGREEIVNHVLDELVDATWDAVGEAQEPRFYEPIEGDTIGPDGKELPEGVHYRPDLNPEKPYVAAAPWNG